MKHKCKQIHHPKIVGYELRRWRNHHYESFTGPLTLSREYWSIWHKSTFSKLKITRWLPKVRDYKGHGEYRYIRVGDVDYYGWQCISIYEVCSCVPLDKPRFITLKKAPN